MSQSKGDGQKSVVLRLLKSGAKLRNRETNQLGNGGQGWERDGSGYGRGWVGGSVRFNEFALRPQKPDTEQVL